MFRRLRAMHWWTLGMGEVGDTGIVVDMLVQGCFVTRACCHHCWWSLLLLLVVVGLSLSRWWLALSTLDDAGGAGVIKSGGG